jgi:hypothetical protein
MFKDKDIFNGDAEFANASIIRVNNLCKQYGLKFTFDIELQDGMTEENVDKEGWLDCIQIIRNDNECVAKYLTCEGVADWASGFCECATMSMLNAKQ